MDRTTAKSVVTGVASSCKALIFPTKVAVEINVAEVKYFRIGVPEEPKESTVLYLVPANKNQRNTFPMQRIGRGYCVELPRVISEIRLNSQNTRYLFTIESVYLDQEDLSGLRLQFQKKAAIEFSTVENSIEKDDTDIMWLHKHRPATTHKGEKARLVAAYLMETGREESTPEADEKTETKPDRNSANNF